MSDVGSTAVEPMVYRLSAGASRIRTLGPTHDTSWIKSDGWNPQDRRSTADFSRSARSLPFDFHH
jgi:hypothetical protein